MTPYFKIPELVTNVKSCHKRYTCSGLFPAKFVPWSLCHLRLHLASPGTGRCLSNDWRSFAITLPSTGERHSIPRASGKNHRELAETWKQWAVVLGWWLIYEVSLKPCEMLFVSAHWFKSPVGSAPRWYKLQFLNVWKSLRNKWHGVMVSPHHPSCLQSWWHTKYDFTSRTAPNISATEPDRALVELSSYTVVQFSTWSCNE